MTLAALSALVVRALHIVLVAFVVAAPFSDDPAVLRAHIWLVPFLWIHWALNNDACALTVLECRLRGVPVEKSFVHGVVSPVYKISDRQAKGVAWVASIAAWCVALWRARQMHVDLRPWAAAVA